VSNVFGIYDGSGWKVLDQAREDVLRKACAVEFRAVGHEDLQGEIPPTSAIRGAGALLQNDVERTTHCAVLAVRVRVPSARRGLVSAQTTCSARPANDRTGVHERSCWAGDERDLYVDALALRQRKQELIREQLGVCKSGCQPCLERREVDCLHVDPRVAQDIQIELNGVRAHAVPADGARAQLDVPW
jgi:hypothetical protein